MVWIISAPRDRKADALFVLKTPLQILNSMEARSHFDFASAALVLLSSHNFPPERLLPLVDPSEWASVSCFEFDIVRRQLSVPLVSERLRETLTEYRWVAQQWARRRRFDAEFHPWRNVENLVLGNYHQPHFMHLAASFPRARCILVDDGTDTLRVAAARRERARRVRPAASRRRLWLNPKRWVIPTHVEWNTEHLENLTFFSSYELDLPDSDTLVRNDYRTIRARMKNGARDDSCLFLGQPLVEDGYVKRSQFLELLSAVKRSLAGRPLTYVPHPREDRAALSWVLAQAGVPALEITKPFEFHLLEQPRLPGLVASFFSSALDNCRLIWGDTIRLIAFRIRPELVMASREFMLEIYRYFETHGKGIIRTVDPGTPV